MLKVEGHDPTGTEIRISRNGKRRALVLAAIQLLIIAHVVLWLLSQKYGWFGGKTLTPVEPSESMMTLEKGLINAGAILFALALLSTLIFGRFFCGWGCHIIMLQDLCAWIMRKLGVRPKPFRSRVLIWVPLLVALYMFVWPTFKRLALFPVLEDAAPAALAYFKPVEHFEKFERHLTTTNFWETFPVVMAIPTLLVVGFAAVYFLGSKGFCTYGCPYGGFFAPLDEFAVGRIRVTDACEGCGHCTVACTSNVRVHEEVREYGMVVDPGCMKCMDCVSTCPNDALYYGFGRPAMKKGEARTKKPRKQYDLSLREDIALGVVFIVLLLSLRGLYLWESVPFLMAVGLAGVGAFASFKAWRLFMPRHELVSIQSWKLKWRGRITRGGWVFVVLVAFLFAMSLQNSVVNAAAWSADGIERAMPPVAREDALSPDHAQLVAPEAKAQAQTAIAWRERTLGIRDGGVALMTNPQALLDLAWLHVVAGEFADAEARLRSFLERNDGGEHLHADLIWLLILQDKTDEAHRHAREVLSANRDWERIQALMRLLERAQGVDRN